METVKVGQSSIWVYIISDNANIARSAHLSTTADFFVLLPVIYNPLITAMQGQTFTNIT